MGTKIFDANNNPIEPIEDIGTADQQTADRSGTIIDPATEATLSTLSVKDFATETTLATMLTEATFVAEDFATQATLAALNTKIVTDADDNSIADSQTLPLSIGLGYGYNGATWERLNSTSGSLDVNITGGISSPTDTDDNNIAGGQSVGLSTGLNYGYNGLNWERLLSTSGRLEVDGSNVIQPISAASLPLPTGAATETTLATMLTEATFLAEDFATETTLSALRTDFNNEDFATQTTLATLLTEATFAAEDFATQATLSALNTKIVTDLDDSSIAAAQTIPLNMNLLYGFGGAAWERLSATSGSLDVNITGGSTSGEEHIVESGGDLYTGGVDKGVIQATRVVSSAPTLTAGEFSSPTLTLAGRLIVDGSQVTQPISAASLPLPTGASTEVTLSALNTKVITDTDDNSVAAAQVLPLEIGLNYGFDGVTWERLTSTSGSLDVNITGGSSGGPTDTDDGSVAGGQSAALTIGFNYGWNGATWERLLSTAGILSVDSTDIHTVDSGGDTYVAGTTEGALAIGRVIDVDAPPTLTIGQISGLTLDLNGSLRVTNGNPDAIESPQNATETDKAFSAIIQSFNLGSAGTETPALLIRNPLASTVTLYLNTLSVNNDVKTQSARIGLYKNPTVTVAGTPVTPSNFKVGSVTASQMTPFSGPTVTANGTLLAIFATGSNQNDLRRTFEFAIILPPNSDLLITGIGSNNNTLIAIGVEWAEV